MQTLINGEAGLIATTLLWKLLYGTLIEKSRAKINILYIIRPNKILFQYPVELVHITGRCGSPYWTSSPFRVHDKGHEQLDRLLATDH